MESGLERSKRIKGMTQETLWQAYCKRNPSFDSNGEVTMTAAGLKKLYDQTWRFAYEAGVADEKESGSRLTDGGGSDLFNQLFGNKKK